MSEVKVGVDPHQLSSTIEVVDDNEARLGSGRFADKTGHAAVLRYVAGWPTGSGRSKVPTAPAARWPSGQPQVPFAVPLSH